MGMTGRKRQKLAALPSVIVTENGKTANPGEAATGEWPLRAARQLETLLGPYYSSRREEWDGFSEAADCVMEAEFKKVIKPLKKSGQSGDSLYNNK